MTHEEIRLMRGDVIDKLTHTEGVICALISKHYFKHVNHEFITDVLKDKSVTLFARKNILKKILKRLQIDTKIATHIERLATIRNDFAHFWVGENTSVPTNVLQDDSNNLSLVDEDNNFVDIVALKKEFDEKFSEVQKVLMGLLGVDLKIEGYQEIPKGPIKTD